jgi:hypothetical protein
MLGALLAAGGAGMAVGGNVNALGSTEGVLVGTFDADIGARQHPQSPASHRVTKSARFRRKHHADDFAWQSDAELLHDPGPVSLHSACTDAHFHGDDL